MLVHNAENYVFAASYLKSALKGGSESIEITVKDRNTASQLLFRFFTGKGEYTNTTGWSFQGLKQLGSKLKTYHWDELMDSTGRVIGHGLDNPHGHMQHLQVITESARKITIFFH